MTGFWVAFIHLILSFCFTSAQYSQDLVKQLSHGGRVQGQQKQIQLDGQQVSINVFEGIPFALPPVGVRRFAPPQKHPGWSGIRTATQPPPACWQWIPAGFDLMNPAARMWLNNTQMSEDCLYLNVWAPSEAGPTNLLPVMVWIYGGGYVSGTSTLDVYDASTLVAKHKVVILSMQYRLGAFGFLRLNPESGIRTRLFNGVPNAESVAMGNQGLLDQLLALEWMHENIAQFGGNPQHVTVFGESSGAVSSSIQWLSPLAQRYFQRVILQSGSAYASWAIDSLEEAHTRAKEFAVSCGCTPPTISREASLKCLQSLDPLTIVNKLDSIAEFIAKRRLKKLLKLFGNGEAGSQPSELFSWSTSSRLYFDVPFKAVVDGYMIPKHPDELFSPSFHASLRRNPQVLLGVNKNEGMFFLLYGLLLNDESFLHEDGTVVLPDAIRLAAQRQPLSPGGSMADFHRIAAAQILPEDQLVHGISQLPPFTYGLPVDTNDTNGYADPAVTKMTPELLMERLDTMTGEMDFICPTLNFAERVAQMEGSKVYLYEFRHRTEASTFPIWTGTMHGYEIEYVFGMPRSEKFQREFYQFNSKEKELSDEVMQMWTNFAKRGDPNINDDNTTVKVTWPQYKAAKDRDPTRDADDHLILDTQLRSGKNLRQAGCRFWLHEIPNLVEQQKAREAEIKPCGRAGTPTEASTILVTLFIALISIVHHIAQW
uniref:Cholinesterase n=1 Tax=Cryptocotyle lingua TaxID=66766 RepID=A0A7U0YF11_9TREM|nr:cholinesterase [Cryptocotyle lingua]